MVIKMRNNAALKIYLLACLVFLCLIATAQIRLPAIINHNMILQRNEPVPVWGSSQPGISVKVWFANQKVTTIADSLGRWKAILAPMSANAEPQVMTISADTSQVILKNILIGEVWLCSGQSNMEYAMKKPKSYKEPGRGVDSAALELNITNPRMRLFTVEKKLTSPDVTSAGWHESGGVALEQASAAGYFFGKHLQKSLDVPVGIISSSWGGTRIERWTPPSAYEAFPDVFTLAKNEKDQVVLDSMVVGQNYKSMIEPLAPFAIKGFLWYQGENNCSYEERGMRYALKMQALVQSWRTLWQKDSLPFYYALIAPHYYTSRNKRDKRNHTTETLPLFWEQQIAASQIPNTGFITLTDLVDDLKDIHPSYKWEVGRRYALIALAKTYNIPKVYSGPQFHQMKINGRKIILSFKDADGLKTIDKKSPDFFTIAGVDGKFYEANAVISKNTVILSSDSVRRPTIARFAWSETARPNLINKQGLPAVPFRTDALHWEYKNNGMAVH
jgi:sialate O-acetylesterase